MKGIEEIEKLKVLHKMAARADSICSFEKEAEGILSLKLEFGDGFPSPKHICSNAVYGIGVYKDS